MSVAEIDAPTSDTEAEPPPVPESLRAIADQVAENLPEGSRVEVLGGEVVVSPTPVNKHNSLVRKIMLQLESQLPDTLVTSTTSEVGFGGENDERAIPDLIVLPADAAEEMISINPPDTVDFVMEVVSRGNAHRDLQWKPLTYARMAIPIYLVVDPREGTFVLHCNPRNSKYLTSDRMNFGDTVKLPAPLDGIEIDTGSFKMYS